MAAGQKWDGSAKLGFHADGRACSRIAERVESQWAIRKGDLDVTIGIDAGPRVVAVVADRLIDGTGRDPVEQAVVVWEDGRLLAAGPRTKVRIPTGAEVIEGPDWTALPGLIDAHVHLVKQAGPDLQRRVMTPRSLKLLYAVPNSAATLLAGVTTVRDAGNAPAGVKLAVERGFFPGPRMQVAVSILSQTGGHTDDYMPCGVRVPLVGDQDVPEAVVDGVDSMRKRVREVLRAGADWIKLCTSGGIMDPSDAPHAAQLTVEEIATAVYEARVQGKHCMAHAIAAEGIKNALRAGVLSIEHGYLLDEEGIELMKASGAYLVPTLVAPRDVLARAKHHPGSVAESMVQKARDLLERHRQAFAAAVAAGVTVAMGTDTGVGEHGDNLRELPLMVEGGMSAMAAIVAATRIPAELLGVSGRLGTLEPGKLADLVVVRGDPIAEITLFDDRSRIELVVKDGAVVRRGALVEKSTAI